MGNNLFLMRIILFFFILSSAGRALLNKKQNKCGPETGKSHYCEQFRIKMFSFINYPTRIYILCRTFFNYTKDIYRSSVKSFLIPRGNERDRRNQIDKTTSFDAESYGKRLSID